MRWGGTNRSGPGDDFFERYGPRRRRRSILPVPWRWRYELGAGLGVPAGLDALATATHPMAAVAVAAAGAVGYAGWPAARNVLHARARTVLATHRLRVGMVQCGLLTWSGRLPAVLWAAPRDRGVEITLWCPAGVDVHAFHATRSRLAAACWASDVEIRRHRSRAHIVVVLVRPQPGPSATRARPGEAEGGG
ncbi:MAG TPA: hypothetical protein VM367_10250 [Pseudonocardia sp.]|nr:hypothetical protein [Pseudonocardia sp.]